MLLITSSQPYELNLKGIRRRCPVLSLMPLWAPKGDQSRVSILTRGNGISLAFNHNDPSADLTLTCLAVFDASWFSQAFPVDNYCILPDGESGILNESNCRSIIQILWGCIAALFACSWVAVHPKIPARSDGPWGVFKTRLIFMMYLLLPCTACSSGPRANGSTHGAFQISTKTREDDTRVFPCNGWVHTARFARNADAVA